MATGRADDLDLRFPIQYVIREHASDYRRVCSSIGQEVRLEAPTGDVVGVVEGIEEAEFSAAIIKYYADNGEEFTKDQSIPTGANGTAARATISARSDIGRALHSR